jgi:Ca2+-binding EF-hand superfamily protein
MAVLKEADLNNDGNIDIDDFFKMMYGENEDSVAIQE